MAAVRHGRRAGEILKQEMVCMAQQNIKIAVELTQLADVLKAFYTVSHIKSTLFDTEFHEVLAYPEENCEFCQIVRKKHIDRCRQSDEQAFTKCRQQQKTIGYNCHIGLYEVISPLRNGDNIIGYIMFGQMIKRGNKEEIIRQILSRYLYLEEQQVMTRTLNDLEARTSAEIDAATLLMQTCICYLLSNNIVRVNRGNFLEELNAYMESHISQEITVGDLCKYFGMSRSSFYALAEQSIDGGVMKYIRSMRIEKARELLRNTSIQVTEISALVGFLDYNYFLRIFKKETGLSCRAYRSREQSGTKIR